MTLRFCLALLAFITLCSTASSQDYWQRRESWSHPSFDTGTNRMEGEYGNEYEKVIFKKLKKNPAYYWNVFTDRDNVPVRTQPKLGAQTTGKQLPMGTMLFVVDEKKEFLKVTTAESADWEKNEELGWIHKQNLILWNFPLQGRKTGIDIKAFIVNTQDYAKLARTEEEIKNTKEIYKIYNSPTSTESMDTQELYQVLFVFKYDPENRRYLVSDHYALNKSRQLTGWVKAERVKLWETSLALEPNFEQEAVDYRTLEQGQLATVFKTAIEVDDYLGNRDTEPLIIRDVAKPGMDDLVITDVIGDSITHVRYEGSLPRFPLYNIDDKSYQCGVIGKLSLGSDPDLLKGVTDERLARAEKKFRDRANSLQYTNIVFAIECSPGMKHYMDLIPKAATTIYSRLPADQDANLRWGFVAYSDSYCEESTAIHEVCPATEIEEFERRLQALADVPNGPQGDEVEASNKGLLTAMKQCGFNENENNILIHIGTRGNIDNDLDREGLCAELSPSLRKLVRKFTEMTANYIAIKCRDYGMPEEDSWFIDTDAAKLIESVSKELYNEVSEKDFFEDYAPPSPPQIVRSADAPELSIDENSVTLMRAFWPDGSTLDNGTVAMDDDRFKKCIVDGILDSRDKADEEMALIQQLYLDNSTLSNMADNLGNVANLLRQAGLSEDEVQVFIKERVQLYWDGNAPKRSPNAPMDMWKLVLFISEDDVRDIQMRLDEVIKAKMAVDVMDKANRIADFWQTIATDVLNMDPDDDDITVADIRARMNGLKSEGVEMGGGLLNDLTISEVRDMKAKEVNAYLDQCEEKSMFWQEVRSGYDFCYYPAGEGEKRMKFYWIPFEFIY